MKDYHRKLTPKLIDLWLAIHLTAARLVQNIPVARLWNRKSRNFDVDVFKAMTLKQYEWCNRHFSFDNPESAANQAEPGDAAYDRHRTLSAGGAQGIGGAATLDPVDMASPLSGEI